MPRNVFQGISFVYQLFVYYVTVSVGLGFGTVRGLVISGPKLVGAVVPSSVSKKKKCKKRGSRKLLLFKAYLINLKHT